MKTYLVTGGAGFIGSSLIKKLLHDENNVIIIDNFNDFYDYKIKMKNIINSVEFEIEKKEKILNLISNNEKKEKNLKILNENLSNKKFKLYIDDIRSQTALENIFLENKIDIVIHLAAMAGVRPSFENIFLYEDVNIKGTLNILETMKKYNLKDFICASSSSVYGNNQKVPFSESDNLKNTLSPYAFTKKSCEELSHIYYQNYGFNIIMLRFFTVYGEGQRPDLAIHKFLKLMKENKDIPFYGDGSSARDYTYIDDIIEGIEGAIKYCEKNNKNSKNIYEIVNLGGNKVITLKEMVETLEKKSGYKANLKKMPFQKGDMKVTFADISKAEKLFRYFPKIPFDKGIENFTKWVEQITQK